MLQEPWMVLVGTVTYTVKDMAQTPLLSALLCSTMGDPAARALRSNVSMIRNGVCRATALLSSRQPIYARPISPSPTTMVGGAILP